MSVAIGTKLHMNLHIVQCVCANCCTFFVNIFCQYFLSVCTEEGSIPLPKLGESPYGEIHKLEI